MRTVSNQIVIVPPGVLQEGTAGIDISEDGQYLFYIHWVKPHTITTFQMATPFEINSGLTLVRTTVIPDSTTTGFPI